jgi:hypothetical protein
VGAALPGAWSHSGERKSLPTFAGLFGAARPRNESLSEASQSLEGAFSALLFTRCVCLPAGGGGAGAAARRGRGAHAAAERRGGAPPGTLRRERAGAGARRGPAGAHGGRRRPPRAGRARCAPIERQRESETEADRGRESTASLRYPVRVPERFSLTLRRAALTQASGSPPTAR